MLEMAEAAVKLYATIGFDEANFAKVASACNTTRSHVSHYFASNRDLL